MARNADDETAGNPRFRNHTAVASEPAAARLAILRAVVESLARDPQDWTWDNTTLSTAPGDGACSAALIWGDDGVVVDVSVGERAEIVLWSEATDDEREAVAALYRIGVAGLSTQPADE